MVGMERTMKKALTPFSRELWLTILVTLLALFCAFVTA
jgi:hypothetical protein